jgi:hypothetical protein
LHKAGVAYFPLYELRHTFATLLSAGGVADHFVTQMLRQGDAAVFKHCSQAKLNMMLEALERLDRQANEHERNFGTAKPSQANFGTVFGTVGAFRGGYGRTETTETGRLTWWARQDSNL